MITTLREALITVLEEFDPGGWYQDPRIDGWVERLATAHDEEDAADTEPCNSEYWSWWIFRPEQTDGYWMRCCRLGPHDEHEDSNTGAKWTDEDAT